MQTPAQASKTRADSGGQRLRMPWAAAEKNNAYLRRGQLAMCVAAPGVGKSLVALNFAVQSGAKTLYLSMDTDAFTTSARLVSSVLERPIGEAELGLASGDPHFTSAASDPSLYNLSLAFPSQPSGKEIVQRLNAYLEARGDFPELLVIDNLQNIGVGDDEFGGQVALMRELQSIATATGTAVLVLHHATGEHEDGNNPLPQSGIRGKLSKFPALIFTLYNSGPQRLGVSVVKNRFGPADPSGWNVRFDLLADKEKSIITNLNPNDHIGHMT